MSIIIKDPELLTQLAQADGLVELKDADGHVIGTFAVDGFEDLPKGKGSPFTHAEMVERRKNRFGRPLKDIMKDLEERFGK